MKKPKKSPKKASPTKLARTSLEEKAGKLLQDMGKLTFASIVLGSSLRSELPQGILTLAGFVTVVVFCVGGLLLEAKEKKPENTEVKVRRGRFRERRRVCCKR